jgi:Flp pilus assembly protein TadG
MMKRLQAEEGASAVEFALVLLPLMLLLMGILDFGRLYDQQLSLSAAAREGVRVMAISNNVADARTAVRHSTDLDPVLSNAQIVVSPATCTSGTTVTVTVTYPMESLTGFFAGLVSGEDLRGRATMRCNG